MTTAAALVPFPPVVAPCARTDEAHPQPGPRRPEYRPVRRLVGPAIERAVHGLPARW